MNLPFEMSPNQLARLQVLFSSVKELEKAEERKFFCNKYSKLPVNGKCMAFGMTDHKLYGGCAYCCDQCNFDRHICPACGEGLHHNNLGREGFEIFEHFCVTPCAQCNVIGHEHHSHRGLYGDWKEYHHPWTQPSMELVPPSTIVGRTDV